MQAMPTTHALPLSLVDGGKGCGGCHKVGLKADEEIERRLKGMHKGTVHVGRVPEGLLAAHEKRQRLQKLHERLEQAVASENYEEAAGLRDEIREIEDDAAVES